MKKGEIETFVAIEDGLVSEVIVTFTLNRSSPLRAPDWQHLISQLVQSDGLAFFDRSTQQRVGGDVFLRLLTESPAWKQFAEAHGWPEIVRADDSPAQSRCTSVRLKRGIVSSDSEEAAGQGVCLSGMSLAARPPARP